MENERPYQETNSELEALRRDLELTRFQLEDATHAIDAIRSGNIDALVVKNEQGHQLYTLKGEDHAYRIFIEQMTEGALTLNLDGTILYCNTSFADLTGLPMEKVIGQPFINFIAHDSRDDANRMIAQAMDNISVKGELDLINISQTGVTVLMSLRLLDLHDGLSLSIILTDLTSQKNIQRQLQQKNRELELAQQVTRELNANLENTVRERTKTLEQTVEEKTKIQERLTQILETMAEGVGIIDMEGNLSYANPMAQRILGFHSNGNKDNFYTNSKWKNFRLDGNPLSEQEHPLHIAINTGRPLYDQEIAVQIPGRELIYISINAAPIYDGDGQIIAGIGTFMDVTNRRKAIQQKDDFISVASHELRTPISTLKASLQLLDRIKDQPPSPMLTALVEQSNKSLNKVTVLINDLLNVSKMSQGQLHLKRSLINLTETIRQSRELVPQKNGLTIDITGNTDVTVYADPDRIEQVVTNMLNNAMKYAAGCDEVLITIEELETAARVTITDKGPGIPPEKLPHLFDRYYRVDEKGNQYSGLGLGLYICAEIVKKHGGEIGASSEIGKGSSFWFTLPLTMPREN